MSACYKKRTLSVTFLFFDFIWILKMTNRIWQNFLASNIHRGINKVAAQKSSSKIKLYPVKESWMLFHGVSDLETEEVCVIWNARNFKFLG